MKYIVASSLVMGLFLIAGCEEKTAHVEEPCEFSFEIDGPPCVIEIELDKNLAEDQRKIAQQYTMAVEEAISTETPEPATSENNTNESEATEPTDSSTIER